MVTLHVKNVRATDKDILNFSTRISQMKIPTLTTSLKNAYKTYIQATEEKKRVETHLSPLLDKLLLEMQIYTSYENIAVKRDIEKSNKLITDRDELYLASDEDAERFYKASHEIYIKEGYDVKMNYCPMLIARSKEVEAEQHFIDESMYLVAKTGLKREKLNSSLSGRREYIKLTLDLVSKMIDKD